MRADRHPGIDHLFVADPVPAVVEVVNTNRITIEPRPSRYSLLRPGKPSPATLSTSLDSLEEPVCDVIHEDFFTAVGKRRFVELGIAVWADDADEVYMVAGDVRNHVSEHAECRNHDRLIGGAQRGSRQER